MYESGIKSYFSLEPAYFLFNLAHEIAYLTDTNLYLQKSCRNFTTSEPNLSTPCDNERKGIAFVASVNANYQLWGGIITMTTTILTSAWTDKAPNRTKFSILIFMWICLFQMISMCLQAYFWQWPALIAVFTEMLFWPNICMRVSSIIYFCNLTSNEDRTFRLTLLHVLLMLTSLIGSGSSGYLLRNLGFFYLYLLCAILTAISVVYATIFMKKSTSKNQDVTSRGCIKTSFEFFDVRSVIQAFGVVFGKRSGIERAVIILMSVINFLSILCFYGESSVLYLYLRYKFGWNEKEYGIYGLYKTAGICVGSMICLGISKYCKIQDSALGLFAAFWDVLASIGYYYADANWQLYLVPLFDIFHGFAVRVCDSIQTKFFKNEEFGQLFSVHMSGNFLLSFGFPLYNLLFKKTMDFAPASIFLISISINVTICVLYGISHLLIKRIPNSDLQPVPSTQKRLSFQK